MPPPRVAAPGRSAAVHVVAAGNERLYCEFKRLSYNWQQFVDQCSYAVNASGPTARSTATTSALPPPPGHLLPPGLYLRLDSQRQHRRLRHLPLEREQRPGRDPHRGHLFRGQFSNGDCPNLIANSATNSECTNGVICKLSWRSDTIIGRTPTPGAVLQLAGLAIRWGGVTPGLCGSRGSAGTLLDPAFPPGTPWATPAAGSPEAAAGPTYYTYLMANLYNPVEQPAAAAHRAGRQLYTCSTCTIGTRTSGRPPTTRRATPRWRRHYRPSGRAR